MANTTSQHILKTAATLLVFCLVVITSFQVGNKSETSMIDEFSLSILWTDILLLNKFLFQ